MKHQKLILPTFLDANVDTIDVFDGFDFKSFIEELDNTPNLL